MLQITKFVIVNSTDSDWKKIEASQNEANSNFPATIESRKNISFSIVATYHTDDSSDYIVDVKYQIMNTKNNVFKIRGKYKSELGRFDLEVYFEDLETKSAPKGSVVSLGWKPNSVVHFILIGTVEKYIGPNINAQKWMQDNLDLLGEVTLNDLCIPGSHDAGMSVYTSGTAFTSACNTLTQSNNIQGQLNLGIRYFDIRPVISGGHFLTGHYKQIIAWQGANGESIESIVDGINAFTAINNELIIIKISHTLNTDVGIFSYRHFSGDEWKRLFYELGRVNDLYKYEGEDNIRNIALNTLTKNGTRSAVLFIIQNSDVSLGG
ncbi:hypothetical protein [Xenorhabdus bovienii]|uniref:hypothetical protein n=1 Tax=Xenorhabdus bovienii TaxID=40576 RepID=UPI003DA5AEE8